MNLHANATTCPNSRELLAKRVSNEGWSHSGRREPPASRPGPSPSGSPATRRGADERSLLGPQAGADEDRVLRGSRRSSASAACG